MSCTVPHPSPVVASMEPGRPTLYRLGRSEIVLVNRCDRSNKIHGLADRVPQGYLHNPALEVTLSHAKRYHRRGYCRPEGVGIKKRQLNGVVVSGWSWFVAIRASIQEGHVNRICDGLTQRG